jgi:L-ascorbate 6-phosphate lactonase
LKSELPRRIEAHEAVPGLTFWSLGGPSLAVRTPAALVYVDLFTGAGDGGSLHKATPDIFDPAAVRRADAVLCTHHDPDHCHEASLRPIYANTAALFVGPCSCVRLFREWGFAPERIVELSAGEHWQVNDLRVSALPCNDYFDADAVSYLLHSGGVTAFEGGDTLFYSGYRDVGRDHRVDVALLNFARNPPDEAYYLSHAHLVRTAEDLGARFVIPKHYDLWEEFRDDPAPVLARLAGKGIPAQVLAPGEHLVYPSPERGA